MSSILDHWPMSSPPRTSQIEVLNWIEKLPPNIKYILCEMPVGCHAAGTKILMYNGTLKNVEDIIIDDLLMGPDSTPRTVLKLHSGREKMYDIVPETYTKFTVNKGHILSLKNSNNKIINISVNNYLKESDEFKKEYKLWSPDMLKIGDHIHINSFTLPFYYKTIPFNIKKTTIDNYYGFSLDRDHLYMLDNCIVNHNSGKSPVGINLSEWLSNGIGNSFILTPQKILQRQYEASFDAKHLMSLVGKANYECHSKNTNCDIGSDIKPKCAACPARAALAKAVTYPNVVLNYTLALLAFKYTDNFKRRKLMVFDECHVLEHQLVEFNAVSISELRCKKLKIFYESHKKLEDAFEWVETIYLPKLMDMVKKLNEQTKDIEDALEFNPRKLNTDELSIIKNNKEYSNHLKDIWDLKLLSLDEIQNRYVLVTETNSFKFKEIYGKNVFHSFVKPMADKFLFMSSTILDKDEFCNNLGLDPNEAAFISVDSEFDVQNRPVFFIPTMKMNYTWSSDERREERHNMLLKIKELCEMHENESGIIHTGNFKIAEWLVNELGPLVKHDIMHHNPETKISRDDIIDEFQRVSSTTPTILISPSITEGLDLKDDLGRFAMIIKISYGNLGDQWVQRRKQLSEKWYAKEAMVSVIQGCGRIVRSKTDYGVAYILDSSFNYLYYNMSKHIPNWWKQGFERL